VASPGARAPPRHPHPAGRRGHRALPRHPPRRAARALPGAAARLRRQRHGAPPRHLGPAHGRGGLRPLPAHAPAAAALATLRPSRPPPSVGRRLRGRPHLRVRRLHRAQPRDAAGHRRARRRVHRRCRRSPRTRAAHARRRRGCAGHRRPERPNRRLVSAQLRGRDRAGAARAPPAGGPGPPRRAWRPPEPPLAPAHPRPLRPGRCLPGEHRRHDAPGPRLVRPSQPRRAAVQPRGRPAHVTARRPRRLRLADAGAGRPPAGGAARPPADHRRRLAARSRRGLGPLGRPLHPRGVAAPRGAPRRGLRPPGPGRSALACRRPRHRGRRRRPARHRRAARRGAAPDGHRRRPRRRPDRRAPVGPDRDGGHGRPPPPLAPTAGWRRRG
jgi:hypothetical protein